MPVGMTQRSPRNAEGIKENHMGTNAQTCSPNVVGATALFATVFGVIAPECTSKLEMGVMDLHVAEPDWTSKLEAKAVDAGVSHDAEWKPNDNSPSFDDMRFLLGEYRSHM